MRVAVLRLLALVLLLFTALRLLADLAEAALVLAERLEAALPRLVAKLAEAAFSRLPVLVVVLALFRAVVLRVLAVAALRGGLAVSARATVVLPL